MPDFVGFGQQFVQLVDDKGRTGSWWFNDGRGLVGNANCLSPVNEMPRVHSGRKLMVNGRWQILLKAPASSYANDGQRLDPFNGILCTYTNVYIYHCHNFPFDVTPMQLKLECKQMQNNNLICISCTFAGICKNRPYFFHRQGLAFSVEVGQKLDLCIWSKHPSSCLQQIQFALIIRTLEFTI